MQEASTCAKSTTTAQISKRLLGDYISKEGDAYTVTGRMKDTTLEDFRSIFRQSIERSLNYEESKYITKSKEVLIAGLQIYNSPITTSKSVAFIPLFFISFTSLIFAVLIRNNIKITIENKKKNKSLVECLKNINGNKKIASKYDKGYLNEVREKIIVLRDLRNEIEHNFCVLVDEKLRKFLQGYLYIYTTILEKEFSEQIDSIVSLTLHIDTKQKSEMERIYPKECKEDSEKFSVFIEKYFITHTSSFNNKYNKISSNAKFAVSNEDKEKTTQPILTVIQTDAIRIYPKKVAGELEKEIKEIYKVEVKVNSARELYKYSQKLNWRQKNIEGKIISDMMGCDERSTYYFKEALVYLKEKANDKDFIKEILSKKEYKKFLYNQDISQANFKDTSQKEQERTS